MAKFRRIVSIRGKQKKKEKGRIRSIEKNGEMLVLKEGRRKGGRCGPREGERSQRSRYEERGELFHDEASWKGGKKRNAFKNGCNLSTERRRRKGGRGLPGRDRKTSLSIVVTKGEGGKKTFGYPSGGGERTVNLIHNFKKRK